MMRGGKYPRILAANKNGEMVFFNSLISASEVIGKTPVQIWTAIKNNYLIDGWVFLYNSEKNLKRIKEYIESPVSLCSA